VHVASKHQNASKHQARTAAVEGAAPRVQRSNGACSFQTPECKQASSAHRCGWKGRRRAYTKLLMPNRLAAVVSCGSEGRSGGVGSFIG